MYLYVSKFTNDPNAFLYLYCRSHIKIILQHIRIYIFTANKNKLLLLALMQHANCRPTATQENHHFTGIYGQEVANVWIP